MTVLPYPIVEFMAAGDEQPKRVPTNVWEPKTHLSLKYNEEAICYYGHLNHCKEVQKQ